MLGKNRVLEQARSSLRYQAVMRAEEFKLTKLVVQLTSNIGRYVYPRNTSLFRNKGLIVDHKRIDRIYRREGLKVP